jgi:hypothetical protein
VGAQVVQHDLSILVIVPAQHDRQSSMLESSRAEKRQATTTPKPGLLLLPSSSPVTWAILFVRVPQ